MSDKETKEADSSLRNILSKEFIINYGSFLLAILALIVSVRSCDLASEAQKLAKKEYAENRLLILKGIFKNDSFDIKVQPLDEGMIFLEGTALFPPSIYEHEIPIVQDGSFRHMGGVAYYLNKYLLKKIPPKEGYLQLSTGGKIPILINSYYAVKGEAYTDQSLYVLSIDVIISDEKYKEPDLNFTGLLFVERYKEGTYVQPDLLDKLISNDKGMYIPPKTP